MKWFIIAASMILLTSCVKHIPEQDIYIKVLRPGGKIGIIKMDAGYLDEINKGKSWIPAKGLEEKLRGIGYGIR